MASYKLGWVHIREFRWEFQCWPESFGEAIFFVGLAAVAAVLFAVYTIVQVQVGPSGLKGSKDMCCLSENRGFKAGYSHLMIFDVQNDDWPIHLGL